MSFHAVFDFSGNQEGAHAVASCYVLFSQPTDELGRPSATVQGGTVVLMIQAREADSLIAWKLDPYKQMEWASLKFMRQDQESVMKQYDLEDVYLTQYSERKSKSGGSHIMITLSPRIENISGVRHEKNWSS